MALPPSPKKSKFRRRLPERKTVNGMDISSGSLNAGSMFTTYGGGGGVQSAGEVIGVTKPGASYIQRQQFILAFRESSNHSQAAEPSLKKDKADKVTKSKWTDVAFGKVMDAMDRDDLLLHESFMVFDCGGDGLISVGEFIRILKKMEPPLKIDRPKMYAMFTAINANGVDRQITPADFVSFFSKLYQQRFRLLDNMARKISTDLETMKELIAEEPKGPARSDLLKEQKAHVKLLSHVQTMLRRVKLVVTAASEFLNQPQGFSMNRTGSGVGTSGTPGQGQGAGQGDPQQPEGEGGAVDTPGAQATHRIGRINEMLCNRIYKRNQILPLAHQVLGMTYCAEGDSLQTAVEQGKWRLERELGELMGAGVDVGAELSGPAVGAALETAPGPFANVLKNVGMSRESVYRATHVRTPAAAGGGRAAAGLIGEQLGAAPFGR